MKKDQKMFSPMMKTTFEPTEIGIEMSEEFQANDKGIKHNPAPDLTS